MESAPRETRCKQHLANDIPFDILCLISLEYLAQETPTHPVETLLLVCKSWYQAALSSSRRWSIFKMHYKDFNYWLYRVPRRLECCSPDALIDIEMELEAVDSSEAIDYHWNIAFEQCFIILKYLSGPEGEIARRWRRFVARSPGRLPYCIGIYGLQDFPTPNLEELELVNVRMDGPIFSTTPALKFYSSDTVMIPLPDLRKATEISIWTNGTTKRALSMAASVVTLKVFRGRAGAYTYHLSKAYLHLTHLRLPEGLREDGLDGFAAPALQELHLDFTRGSEFLCVVACEGLPFSKLKKVAILSSERIRDVDTKVYVDGIRAFLHAASHIEGMDLPSPVSQAFVLKLLTTDCEELYQDHDVAISSDGYETTLGRGESRQWVIDKFHGAGVMVPSGTWEKLFNFFKWHPLPYGP